MSWALGTDCCSWEGINCRGENTVRDISLPSKGLAGSISPSLSNLTKLLHLNLSHNSLSGGLPMDSLLFSSIAVLDVSFNHLDGPLQELQSSNPSLSLPLQVMNISSNFFTGQFPSAVRKWWKTWLLWMQVTTALQDRYQHLSASAPHHLQCLIFGHLVQPIQMQNFPKSTQLFHVESAQGWTHNVTGAIPNELFSYTSLEHLSFPLQGVLDSYHIVKLGNLTFWLSLILDQLGSVARSQTL